MSDTEQRKMLDHLMRGQDAARLIGVSRPTVVAMVAREEIRGQMVGNLLFVHREDAERVAAEREAERANAARAAAVAPSGAV
jgi:excisionase family DNA binding protein